MQLPLSAALAQNQHKAADCLIRGECKPAPAEPELQYDAEQIGKRNDDQPFAQD